MPDSLLQIVQKGIQQNYGHRVGKTLKKELTPGGQALPIEGGLDPYEGEWNLESASHVLRRALFGHSRSQLQEVIGLGLDATVDALLSEYPLPDPPVNPSYSADPNVPIGETWVFAPDDVLGRNYRRRSLWSWTFKLMQDRTRLSIREKMVLFWHNHFVTADINDPRISYRYIDTIRQHALGNFRELTKAITVDPAMLLYLNGNENTNRAPNENYARELVELFTIGKGPLAGPGDYTNYTEDDIAAMAKVLTGWRVRAFVDDPDTPYPIDPGFNPNLHDESDKQLSHRFDNVVIENNGENEYSDLIDIIFTKDEVARHFCRKLYRWFVHYVIDEQVEVAVIQPLAQIMVDNDYEVKPVLAALFKSEHFNHPDARGCMIKNPIDFLSGIFNAFEVEIPSTLMNEYAAYNEIYNVATAMQMQYFYIPQVAGWKAYYQEPVFYRTWINSTTIPIRNVITDVMAYLGYRAQGERVIIDILEYVKTLSDPADPNTLISELSQILLPFEADQNRIDALKEVLIPGLPDFEWTVEYSDHLANPDDELLELSVKLKLQGLIATMMHLPEYNLS